MMANMTQKLDRPVVLPRILGPMMLPSTCCRMKIMMMNLRAAMGSTMRSRMTDGIAPMKGPKNGMMFVTPTITLMSMAMGRRRIDMETKHRRPMMRESMTLPLMNPPNVSLLMCPSSKILPAVSSLQTDRMNFLACA